MAQLDIQSTTAMYEMYTYSIPGDGVYHSDPLPMENVQQGICVIFFASPSITPDTLTYSFRVRADGGPWVTVPNDSILPTWNHQYNNTIYPENAGLDFWQTAGFSYSQGAEWQTTITASGVSAPIQLSIAAFGVTDGTPFTGWVDKQFPESS
jgi:hypothetical protein